MIARDAVQRLGDVSRPLQDDFLGRRRPSHPGQAGPLPPAHRRPRGHSPSALHLALLGTRRGTPPSLGPDCDRTYFLMGKEPPSGEHFNTPSVPPAPTAQRPLRDARGQGSTEGTGFGVRGTGPRPEGSSPRVSVPQGPPSPSSPGLPTTESTGRAVTRFFLEKAPLLCVAGTDW